MIARLARVLPCLFLVASSTAVAYEIDSLDVQHEASRYRVELHVKLDVPAADAYAAFADVDRLPAINPAVKTVRSISGAPAGASRVYTDIRVCVALFCRHLEQVQDMRYAPHAGGGAINATVIPELSNLRFGEARWTLDDCAGRTCLSFVAQLEPAFWIPPFIGPWLIQRKLREEAMQTSAGIERAARALADARS
ncbi:MAG: hypothetical protein ACT4QA_05105 [Panacagrimonas sp.]